MEEWRDIKGYEGRYQISSEGRVRSLDRIGKNGYSYKGKILKPRPTKRGYIKANLSGKIYAVHRLVAQAFIPNPNNYPVVNHKDENPSNNCIENLEWCDVKYNINYGTAKKTGAKVLIRGIRNTNDFAYEFDLSVMNRNLNPEVDTLFVPTEQKYAIVRSSSIKELARFGGDISEMVPPIVEKALYKKFPKS